MKGRDAIQGLQDIRGILTKKERCFSDVMAERAADGRELTDEEVLTVVRLLRKYGISRREDSGPADVHMGGDPPPPEGHARPGAHRAVVAARSVRRSTEGEL